MLNLLLGCVLISPKKVFFNCSGEKNVLLEHHCNAVAKGFEVVFANVFSANEHGTFGNVIKAGYHLNEGGFRGTGSAKYANCFTGFYIQANVVKTGFFGFFGIFEKYVLKFDAAVRNLINRVLTVFKVAFFRKNFADSFCTFTGNGDHNKEDGYHHNAHEYLHGIGDKAHEHTGGKSKVRVVAGSDYRLGAKPGNDKHA